MGAARPCRRSLRTRRTAARDRAVRAAPAEHEQRRAPSGSSTSSSGMSAAIPATFCARRRTISVVVVRVVGDVAGPVRLLEAADPVLEARRARHRPRPRERLGVAEVRQELAVVVRPRRERRRRCPAATPTSGSSHGSEPFARYASESRKTGVRYLSAIRAASIAASKQSPGVDAATTGTGDSALRPNSTISRSACSGFVGMPGRGAGALDVEDQRAAARASRRARPSRPSARCPGPAEVVTPSAPPNARAERGAHGGDLVLGLERADAEVLVAGELLEDRRRRRDRVRAEEERQPALHAAATRPSASAWLPVMLR